MTPATIRPHIKLVSSAIPCLQRSSRLIRASFSHSQNQVDARYIITYVEEEEEEEDWLSR